MQDALSPKPVYWQQPFIGKPVGESVRESIIKILLLLNAGGGKRGDMCLI